jgi:probable HAF family extracellular repeat protein
MQRASVRWFAWTCALLALAAMAADLRALQADDEREYRVSELRGLRGSDSRANSVNDWGLAAGYANLPNDDARRAMVWFLGHGFPLGSFGGPNSNVTWSGQNNTGLVVGIAQTNKPQTRSDGWSCRGFFPSGPNQSKYTCLGFVWEWGRMTRLPTFGGDNGFATSANNFRQVVGWAETDVADPSCDNPEDRGFLPALWDLNSRRTLRLPLYGDDTAGAATAINDRGQIVGISGECDQSVGRETAKHAVLWQHGAVRDLGTLGADTWNTPTAINARGDIIVGFANSPGADPSNPLLRAFLWSERDDLCPKLPGTDLCDLGTLDVGGTAQAWGVNDDGQVVGSSCLGAVCKAFLWEKGEMKDLNSLKGSYPRHLENAMDINAHGQISGRAQVSTVERVAFVAAPKRRR